MNLTEEQKANKARWEASCKVFATIPGAETLISKYGKVPSFHDGEVEMVYLAKRGHSRISISINWPTNFDADKILVTLTAREVIDVALEGFSPQNVIGTLWVRVPVSRLGYEVSDGDVEVELDPIYGIGGTVWLRNVEVTWTAL